MKKTVDEMKEFIKAEGKAHLVKELITGLEVTVESAVEYVYDTLTLSNEQFRTKYFN